MEELLRDYEERKQEINCYYNFIKKITSKSYVLKNIKRKKDDCLDNRIIKILKANMFLLLYNLIESTVDNSVKYACKQIAKENIGYSIITEGLKKQWVNVHSKKHLQSSSDAKLKEGIKYIIDKTIEEYIKFEDGYEIEYSNNIDNKVLFQIARDFGFKLKFADSLKGGHNINEIKKKRNWLAHGNVTFTSCGQDTSIADLSQYKSDTFDILEKFIKTIDKYVKKKKYKTK